MHKHAAALAQSLGFSIEREDLFEEVAPNVMAAEGAKLPRLVDVKGAGLVILGQNSDATGATIRINTNAELGNGAGIVYVGAFSTIRFSTVDLRQPGSYFAIDSFSTTTELRASCFEGQGVSIGGESMFSNRIIIESSDHHAIYDLGTGERINGGSGVHIGRHVWIGRDTRINKGAIVADDCIIGQNSLVTGTHCADPHAIYAGIPARKIRANVTWSRMQAESLSAMEASVRHKAFLEKKTALAERIRERPSN